MGVESGEGLEQIVRRKEAERRAGNGQFWWGIGNSLGAAVREAARAQSGRLPVVFSVMLAKAKLIDTAPQAVWRWTGREDEAGHVHDVPGHVRVVSRGEAAKDQHYALVCHSDVPLAIARGKPFDPDQCRTLSGKKPGASQVTALLRGKPDGHRTGRYEASFQALLIEPWSVKLVRPVPDRRGI
jgi:hypothetical protein